MVAVGVVVVGELKARVSVRSLRLNMVFGFAARNKFESDPIILNSTGKKHGKIVRSLQLSTFHHNF